MDAVIDKDLASAKLAEEVSADIFLIATDVKRVAINYGKPDQKFLSSMTLNEADRFLSEGLTVGVLRARAKITSHFYISASAHLWPIPHSPPIL